MILDNRMREITKNVDMLVPWWLCAAYAYEIEDNPILSDGAWDELCKRLKLQWNNIRHRHKWLIDRHQLITGTAHYMSEDDYPSLVIGAVKSLRNQEKPLDPKKQRRRERRAARLASKASANVS